MTSADQSAVQLSVQNYSRFELKHKSNCWNTQKTRENTIVEYLDYQIPVTQLKGPKRNGDMRAVKRDWNAPPTRDLNIWLCGR